MDVTGLDVFFLGRNLRLWLFVPVEASPAMPAGRLFVLDCAGHLQLIRHGSALAFLALCDARMPFL